MTQRHPILHFDSPPIDVLGVALPDAVAWCGPRAKVEPAVAGPDEPDGSLRSLLLCPPLFSPDPCSTVWSVVQRRQYALGALASLRTEPSLAGGRILYYEPDRNLADGAACLSSRGFFDVDNVPAWDTWLCYADQRFVVSWVPPQRIDDADAGVEVNPECCIRWAKDVDTPFSQLLRARGLL